MHKDRNFLKKLNRCGLCKPTERAACLFHRLTDRDHRGYAQSCLEEIFRMDIPRLTKHITKYITPRLNNFAKTFLSEHRKVNESIPESR
jgi:hypothetical protein